jgi:hypothetical protein
MGDISTYRCSCGDLLTGCRFWKEVKERMRERGIAFDFANFGTNFNEGPTGFRRLIRMGVRHRVLARLGSLGLQFLPQHRRHLNQIVQQNRMLIDVITQLQKGQVFLDGSKDPERLQQFLHSAHWKIKIVRLVRDGRGVVNSYMKHSSVGIRVGVREWLDVERACRRVLSRIPFCDRITVQYEDLCQDPQKVTRQIFRFAGLDPDKANSRERTGNHHILGNQSRLRSERQIILDDRWRHDLMPLELATFSRLGGVWNQTNGYNGR